MLSMTQDPENRLVARSLEKAWEERLRAADAVEQEYRQWAQREPTVLTSLDRETLEALASDLPSIWNAPTTKVEERKRILRYIIQEVILDQKRSRGRVWIKIIWQTGAVSEHQVQRRVHSYDDDYSNIDHLRRRVTQLNASGLMDRQIADILNTEQVTPARGRHFTYENVWLMRKRWGIPTTKINGAGVNPLRWPDGSYSVQGAAAAIGVTPQTVFDYLESGLLSGRQLTKGQPWKIDLSEEQISQLRARLLQTRRSKKEAS
jgi:hypothetical protein